MEEINFIATNEKTGLEIITDILKKLKEDGLYFKNCHKQVYANRVNMAGKYRSGQAGLHGSMNVPNLFLMLSAV